MRDSRLPKLIIAAIGLAAGLLIGLGVGHMQMKKAEKVFQGKLKEAGKKTAFIQKRLSEEKDEAVASMELQHQGELDKLQGEKKALGGKLGKLKEEAQKLELRNREADEAVAGAKKELHEKERKNKGLDDELKKITGEKHALEAELKKAAGEKQTLQAELQKTGRDLGRCETNNAELCTIAEELVKKYRDKGVGSVLLAKEPLTQIKKVKLEHLVQEYREEIERLKNKKK